MKSELQQATAEYVATSLGFIEKLATDVSKYETAQKEAAEKGVKLATRMRALGLIREHEEKEASQLMQNPSASCDMMEIFLGEYSKLLESKQASANGQNLGGGENGGSGSADVREHSAADRVMLDFIGASR